MDWAERYRPRHVRDIVGNAAVIRQMAAWAQGWTRQSRPLLLYGKPGTGKTSSAGALANDMGWEVVELNASDQRTAGVIERIAGAGSTTASLTGASRKLIVLDEVDNLQGTADRGGARAILACIRESRQPMILIANDLYGIPAEIRLRCEPLQFRAIPARSIAPRLTAICSAEQIACSDAAIRQIAESAEGDMRSAVNMLFAAGIGRQAVGDADVRTGRKDERISIFTLISALAARKSDEELLRLSRELEDTPDTIEQWIEGNLTAIVPAGSIGTAYRHLARADEYLGYTYRRQYHTLWRYATALMLLGVAGVSAGGGVHARIMPPARWQKMAGARKQRAIRTLVLAKLAELMHVPATTLRGEYLSAVALLVESDPEGFAADLMLDADQLNFFLSDKARSQTIVRKLADAAREAEKERRQQAKAEQRGGERAGAQEQGLVQDGNGTKEPEAAGPGAEEDRPAGRTSPSSAQSTLFNGF